VSLLPPLILTLKVPLLQA